MKREERSSVPVTHATREQLNLLKREFNLLKRLSQVTQERQIILDDIIRFLLDHYEAHRAVNETGQGQGISAREIIPWCISCGVYEGELHHFGCELEACPFCGGRLTRCDCITEHMYEPPSELRDISEAGLANICELLGVPREDFQKINDLWLNIQRERWLAVLKKKGRVPFIWYPNVCARCGKLDPLLFMVPKEEWNRYVQPDMRDKVLCRACYDEIKALIDTGKKKR